MSEASSRIEDVEKMSNADDETLREARARRNAVFSAAAGFGKNLGTYPSGSVAMGVANDPVEDADGGLILDRRYFPALGPDGDGDTPSEVVADIHAHVSTVIRETWSKATVHDMKRGLTVRMHAPLLNGQDPYVDLVIAMNRSSGAGLWIPNLAAGRWDPSDPAKHVALMTSGPRSVRRCRARVVRLAKVWNKQFSSPGLSSFNIVALGLECITTSEPIDVALHRFFDHAATSLAVRRTDDPAGVSGPIKLEEPKDIVVKRLTSARDHLAAAIAAGNELETVAVELHQVFGRYLPDPQTLSTKASVADALRTGTPRLRGAAGLAVAGAVTPKRAFGGQRG